MNDSTHAYGCVCSHVPMWVRVCLSTFLHKCLGVSENVSVPHEPPETSMCFCMCVCVCICVFASLRLWISKHIVWMAYIHVCVLLWVCASVEYIFMTICCSVPTHRAVGIHVYLCACICVSVQTWADPCWDSVFYVHICANMSLAAALRMYSLWD